MKDVVCLVPCTVVYDCFHALFSNRKTFEHCDKITRSEHDLVIGLNFFCSSSQSFKIFTILKSQWGQMRYPHVLPDGLQEKSGLLLVIKYSV